MHVDTYCSYQHIHAYSTYTSRHTMYSISSLLTIYVLILNGSTKLASYWLYSVVHSQLYIHTLWHNNIMYVYMHV